MKTMNLLLVAALFLTASSAAASTDPFLGKWKLNVQRSRYPAGTCPKRMRIEMKSSDRGIEYLSDTTYPNGNTTQARYTAAYDSKQAAVFGAHGMLLPVSLKRLNSHTVIASYKRGLQEVASSRRVVSADGRLMTITTQSADASGRKITTVGIYEKE